MRIDKKHRIEPKNSRVLLFVQLAAFVIALALPAVGQSPTGANLAQAQADVTSPFTISVDTRQVVIAVIARDKHNQPVRDLSQNELQVFEIEPKSVKSPQTILAMRIVDPSKNANPTESSSTGFHVTAGGGCAIATTFHYELVFPASSFSGYHEVWITTSRPHVTLSFRRRYYVGQFASPSPVPPPQTRDNAKVNRILEEAACYHSALPSSIALRAQFVDTGSTNSARYSLVIRADSLGFLALSDQLKRIELDYGVCTFDSSGMPLKYLHTSVERVLSSEEFQRATAHGLPNLLDLPQSGEPAYARFIVRDRATGNTGRVDVTNPLARISEQTKLKRAKPPTGSIRAFGSVVPDANAFCGDVYELPGSTDDIPDFWDMDPIGSVYVNSLDIPDQNITEKAGIPGVTTKVSWFGIDYHGEFWITTPGDYSFRLSADDGADLYIDDQPIIRLGGSHPMLTKTGKITLSAGKHLMHIPYFQGPPVELALVLEVRPPGGKYETFDLQDYGPSPQDLAATPQ